MVVNAGEQYSPSYSFTYAAPLISSISYVGSIPTSGFIGNSPYVITINGISFGTSSGVVNVGGTSCSIVSQNHTQIRCNVPSGMKYII